MTSYRYPRPVPSRPGERGQSKIHRPFYAMAGGDLMQPVPQTVSRSAIAAPPYSRGFGDFEDDGDISPIIADEDKDSALAEALLLQRLQALRSQADWGRRVGAENSVYGANLWHNLGNVLAPDVVARMQSKKLMGDR